MASPRPTSRSTYRKAGIASGYKTVSLIAALLALRIYNALSIQTFFQPDEYFQSLEPAWASAFGLESGAWITWEWREHLRSSLHPLLFAGVYRVVAQVCHALGVTQPVRAEILIAAPKVLQAVFAACTDLFTYRLASKIYGRENSSARVAILLTVLSPWQWFCSTRTFSNSVEATLTIMALNLWPWNWFITQYAVATKVNGSTQGNTRRPPKSPPNDVIPTTLYASLTAAALACILRPTNIVVWAAMSLVLVFRRSAKSKIAGLIQSAAISGSAVFALSFALDWQYYREPVFPPLRFLQFNVVEQVSTFYGTNRLHYYVTEAVALLLTTALPFAIAGLWHSLAEVPKSTMSERSSREQQIRPTLALAVLASIAILTLVSHKEVRFIYPLLPILHILAAKPLATFLEPLWSGQKRYRAVLLLFGLAINTVIGYYAGYVHQRGVIDVMHYLRQEFETRSQWVSVGFLMPCHSTPWRSHFVYPGIEAWALTCEPPLGLTMEERKGYLDEADVFYADPAMWMKRNMQDRNMRLPESGSQDGDSESRRSWPDYVVFFEHLEPAMKEVLWGSRYDECWRGFNTHWHDDWRRQGDVIVWCTDGQ